MNFMLYNSKHIPEVLSALPSTVKKQSKYRRFVPVLKVKKPLNTSKLHAKVNSEKWEKPFLWTYYLADAYKKTLRVKINQYFNPETTNYFIFASLPFLIYLGQLSNAKYNKYKNNLLFQKTLPGLTSEIPKVSWETLNYTQYKKSLNLNNINHIYYSDNNAFITLNPKWSSEQNSWYVGTFRPDQDMQRKSNGVYQPPNLGINSQAIDYVSRFDWFSIPSRNFTRQYKKSINNQNVNWNFLFHASDDIPSKLQSIYPWGLDLPSDNLTVGSKKSNYILKWSDVSIPMKIWISKPTNPFYLVNIENKMQTNQFNNFSHAKFDKIFSPKYIPINLPFDNIKNQVKNHYVGLDLWDHNEQKVKKEKMLIKQDFIETTNNKIDNKIDHLFNFFMDSFHKQLPLLSDQRQVTYNLFNSLNKYGFALKLTSKTTCKSYIDSNNLAFDPCFQKISNSSLISWKQALRTDLLTSNPPWIQQYFNDSKPNFDLFSSSTNFEKVFFDMLKDYLFNDLNNQNNPKTPFQSKSNSVIFNEQDYEKLVTLPMKSLSTGSSHGSTLFEKTILNDFKKDQSNQSGEQTNLALRKLSGYLNPDCKLSSKLLNVSKEKNRFNLKFDTFDSSLNETVMQIDGCPLNSSTFSFHPNQLENLKSEKSKIHFNDFSNKYFVGPNHDLTSSQIFFKPDYKSTNSLNLNYFQKTFSPSPLPLLHMPCELDESETPKTLWSLTDNQLVLPLANLSKTLTSRSNLAFDLKSSIPLVGNQSLSIDKPFKYSLFRLNDPNQNNSTLSYKTHWNYTEVLNNKRVQYLNLPKSFKNELYEPLTKSSWSIISQAGFLYIVLLFFAIVQNEYREELLNYVKTFSIYLSDNAKQRLQSASIDDNYRVIRNSKVSLKSVVGSESILPIFANLILYLISARHIASKIPLNNLEIKKFDSNTSQYLSLEKLSKGQSFLLVGPPGTGKTLLVSALAGEAQVPVIIEYGKMFQTDFEQHGGDKLKMVFEAAKSISPCLLFLDEIDKIGKRRSHVVLYTSSIESEAQMPNTLNFPYLQNGIGESDSLFSSSFSKVDQYDIPTRSKSNLLESSVSRSNGIETMGPLQTTIQENQISMSKQNSQDVMMLTQLLNQVDGLTDHRNIIVIGATNRPTILDPALTRPGRFDKVIYLDLPGKRKRLDLFKFYSSPGHDSSLNNDLEMNWNYFAKQTSGLSAAHISAAMNRSLLKVIYSSMNNNESVKNLESNRFINENQHFDLKSEKPKNTPYHTFDSIEYGIQMVSKTNMKRSNFESDIASKFNKTLLGNFVQTSTRILETSDFNQSLFFSKLPILSSNDFNNESLLKSELLVENNPVQAKKTVKGLLPKNVSNQVIKRSRFYSKHKVYLRSLALLNANMKSSLEKDLKFSKVIQNLTVTKRYLKRLIQNQTFGWQLLSSSTANVSNIFFDLSLRIAVNNNQVFNLKCYYQQTNYDINLVPVVLKIKQYNKKQLHKTNQILSVIDFSRTNRYQKISSSMHLVYDHLFNLNNSVSNQMCNQNLFKSQKLNSILQWQDYGLEKSSKLFGDDLFICREAYYLSGQCLMYAVLPEKAHFSPGNLWSLSTGKDSMRSIGFDKVLKSLISQFNTKAQYEYYLLFLISGKVSETLMLINNDSKNDSSLGNESLKIVGQMILFMRDKYLFYSPKLLTRKQIQFNLLQNTLQLPSQEDYALLQGMTGFSEIQNQSNISFPEKGIRRYDLSFNLDKPWWQLKSFYQISSISRKYGQWYRIFLTDSIQNYRNIEWVPPEKHYHNQTNTSFNFEKALTTDQVLIFFSFEFLNWISTNSQSLRFFKDHLNYYFDLFNHVLSILLIESNPDAKLWENLNWNSIELFQESNLMSNLVFELFNDSFELLETNRSFLDCLVYLLLCNSSISDFSRESYSNRFFPSKSISE